MELSAIPDWLGTAVFGSVAAAVGFFAKSYFEERKERRARKLTSLEQLRRLAALLQQSDNVFTDQNKLVRRLWRDLSTRLGSDIETGRGFDEDFFSAYDRLTVEEKELHAIIRGMTMNSLRTVNTQLAQWLSEDLEFKLYSGTDTVFSDLKGMLQRLERHISAWHDKYASVLAGDLKRSLVYLGDEKEHGEPFPQGIERVVERAIQQLSP